MPPNYNFRSHRQDKSRSRDGGNMIIRGDLWSRLLHERLAQPLHLNVLAIFVKLLGGYRMRVAFDLVRRRHYAYCVLRAADLAGQYGVGSVTVVELGVAMGSGLLNLCELASRTARETGIDIRVVGFDSGTGLPPTVDYRDHPELFQHGDFPMDVERLRTILPKNGRLVIGPLAETVPQFARSLNPESPLGFVAVDVDLYSSASDGFKLFSGGDPARYLPLVFLYLDDITEEFHNSWCGELLAVSEFNAAHKLRKIERDAFLASRRFFSTARWLRQIYLLHVLDHPVTQGRGSGRAIKTYQSPAGIRTT